MDVGAIGRFSLLKELDELRHYNVLLEESTALETGKGCFGAVYKSRLASSRAPCAVKKVHEILTGYGGNIPVGETEWKTLIQKFVSEILLLSRQRHPNIVQFLGVSGIDGDPRCIALVMENMEMSVEDLITKHKGVTPLPIKLSVLNDTSKGLAHLHVNGIVHRDLNAGNVLLTASLRAKVADLGISRVIDRLRTAALTRVPGAADFMPPEALNDKPEYGPKLDSFSFGHLGLYLLNEEYPALFEVTTDDLGKLGKEGFQVLKRKKWLDRLEERHASVHLLIRTCLNDKPEDRWDMERISKELDDILSTMSYERPGMIELMEKQKEYESQTLQLRLSHETSLQHKEEEMKERLDRLHQAHRKELDDIRTGYKKQWTQLKTQISTMKSMLAKKDEEITNFMQQLMSLQSVFATVQSISNQMDDGESFIDRTFAKQLDTAAVSQEDPQTDEPIAEEGNHHSDDVSELNPNNNGKSLSIGDIKQPQDTPNLPATTDNQEEKPTNDHVLPDAKVEHPVNSTLPVSSNKLDIGCTEPRDNLILPVHNDGDPPGSVLPSQFTVASHNTPHDQKNGQIAMPIDKSTPSVRDHQQPPYRKRFLSDVSDSNIAMSDHNAMSDSTVDSHTAKILLNGSQSKPEMGSNDLHPFQKINVSTFQFGIKNENESSRVTPKPACRPRPRIKPRKPLYPHQPVDTAKGVRWLKKSESSFTISPRSEKNASGSNEEDEQKIVQQNSSFHEARKKILLQLQEAESIRQPIAGQDRAKRLDEMNKSLTLDGHVKKSSDFINHLSSTLSSNTLPRSTEELKKTGLTYFPQ